MADVVWGGACELTRIDPAEAPTDDRDWRGGVAVDPLQERVEAGEDRRCWTDVVSQPPAVAVVAEVA